MRKKIILIILSACLAFNSVTVFAEEGSGEISEIQDTEIKDPEIQQNPEMHNIITLYSEHDEVYVGEKIRVISTIRSVDKGAIVKAVWKVNGEEVPEFPGETITLKENMHTLFAYFVPPYGEANGMTVSLSLYDQEDQLLSSAEKILKVKKEIPVSIIATTKTQKEYFDKEVTASVLLGNETGRYFEFKAHWELNGEKIEGYDNDNFAVGMTADASCPVNLNAFVGEKVKVTFVLDNGICSISLDIWIEVLDYPPEVAYRQKVAEMRKTIRTTEIECTLVRDSNIYKDYTLKSKIAYKEKGTKGIYIDYSGTKSAKVRFPDGTIGWLPFRNISISKVDYTDSKVCSDEMKELFANDTGYKSDTEYLIWISLKFQQVNVFSGEKGKWKLVRSAVCATGKNTTPTIRGIFKYFRYEERWNFGKYYVGPVMRFHNGTALHSRTYKPDGSLLDPTLGKPASHGCIRMKQEDIDWMAENIPLKTTVVVF